MLQVLLTVILGLLRKRDDINYWVAAEEGYEKGRIGLRVTLPVPRPLHSAK